MISFKDFVTSLYDKVVEVNQLVGEAALQSLDRFFLSGKISQPEPPPPLLAPPLVPDTISFSVPSEFSNKVGSDEVKLQTIHAVPKVFHHVSPVQFRMELKFMLIDDELMVTTMEGKPEFPRRRLFQAKSETQLAWESATVLTLVLKLTPFLTPENLQELIEKYDAVIRSRIPQ